MPNFLGPFRQHPGDDRGDYVRGFVAAVIIVVFVGLAAWWVTTTIGDPAPLPPGFGPPTSQAPPSPVAG